MTSDTSRVRVDEADDVVTLTLNRPERHNALVPELLAPLNDALRRVAAAPPAALVLRGAGRSFSSGGDVGRFHATPRGVARQTYAHGLVGALNDAILALLRLPCPTVAVVHGMVTGGAIGLVLGCDIAVGSPRASFAPWYTAVGYSPDGGWTALLPERIGRARALDIQLLNRRIDADEAHRLGLLQHLVQEPALDEALAQILGTLRQARPGSVRHTLALTRPDPRQVAERLEAERTHFLEQIATDEAEHGMAAFLNR
ncbi:enoyl-CoA hydratase/isomerase family protein [Verticiella sediminum]|uniref:Enoyl-CoA hydratase/isomerase family protein n=1 Tax=Verticiella sediminum TaxID=1247510 RepID=A0A556AWQ8_9BURK|nr:enoyl-CoA hydratase/isomerase family protein [Verticiella sediminum]TSH97378.1 enoyl-CoA hydratase/isomerase family protein [Verticiella sediminum]